MRNIMSENEKTILKLLRDKGGAKYTDIEPLMKMGSHDKFWTTFSTICSLISAGVIVSENKYPSTYTLTPYGKSKVKEVL